MAESIQKYTTGSYPFPRDDINPADKNEKWGKKNCEAIYSRYIRGKTAIPFSALNEIKALRDLADGRQDIRQYQKMLLDESDDDKALTGYININWDVFSVMPKFLRVVEGIMEQTDHQVVATTVDSASTEEREEAKLNMAFRMRFKDQLQQIESQLGIGNVTDFVPDSIEELNIYEGAGGFKLGKEIEIEQGLDYTFYISLWKEIKKKIIRDACVIGCACTKDYVDQYTKKVKVRYVDPAKFIGEFSNNWDHRNMTYAGEVITVSISDLRKLLDIPETELLNLARDYNGRRGNGSIDNFTYDADNRTATYDSFLVDVYDAEWKSVNSEFYTTRKNKYDNEISYREDWGKVYNTEKRKTSKYDIQVVYRCKWIIGTDYVYDFGLQHDIPRPGKKEVELSFHFYKLPGRSLASLSETHLHQMALAFYRLQNAIALAAPAGVAIEFTSLQNMALGKKKMDPLDLLKIRTQTGILIYRATTHKGLPNTPGGWKPIQELTGGIGPQLKEFLEIFEFNINAIREITGINQIADASTPNPEQSVGGSELAIAATNNALRPIYSGYIHLKEQSAKNISLRIQLLVKHNNEAYKGYMPVLGKLGVQIISVGADAVDADYFIKYEAKPTEKRKFTILDAATKAMSPDRDGIIGIELPDYLMIERLLEAGSLKFAEAYLNYKSKKNKERQLQLQRENMEIDSQREKANVAAKAKAEADQTKLETDEELRLYRSKKEIDEEFAKLQHERDKEKLSIESSLNIVQDVAKNNVTIPT